MEIFTNSVPIWVSLSFFLTFPLAIFLMAGAAKEAAVNAAFSTEKNALIYRSVLGFGLMYLGLVALLSFTGIFRVNVLPPRILVFTAIPLFVFLMTVVFRSNIFRDLLAHASLPTLIRIHVFRLVGVFFLITYAYGALPKHFALIGGIGDIFAAITAIFVANAVEKGKTYGLKLAFAWNIVGLIDILNVIVAAFITTRQAIAAGEQGLIAFTDFPFSWIPAFAPATIVFLHVAIFKKINRRRF